MMDWSFNQDIQSVRRFRYSGCGTLSHTFESLSLPTGATHKSRAGRQSGDCVFGPGYFATIPLSPPPISEAMSVKMRGNDSPPGDARYFGTHRGSNFSLYCRKP
jgi:hypothetical protein